MAYIKTRQPRGRQGMNRAIGWDCSQRHGIGQHHMPSYVYIKISSRPGLFFFGFPNIPVFLAWIGSWTWFLKHQSRVAIAKPREVVKKAISNTLDASEFGLEVSKVSISTTFDHPEGSCCYCIPESVLSGWRRQELHTSLLQFWQTPSRRASEIFSYQGSAKTCHQHLLHIWVWCRPMLSSLAVE